jgi:hypothetical protein
VGGNKMYKKNKLEFTLKSIFSALLGGLTLFFIFKLTIFDINMELKQTTNNLYNIDCYRISLDDSSQVDLLDIDRLYIPKGQISKNVSIFSNKKMDDLEGKSYRYFNDTGEDFFWCDEVKQNKPGNFILYKGTVNKIGIAKIDIDTNKTIDDVYNKEKNYIVQEPLPNESEKEYLHTITVFEK